MISAITDLMEAEKHIDELVDFKITEEDIKKNVAVRPTLEELNVNEGVRGKLYGMFYRHGPGLGTALFLPFDQKSTEHGSLHMYLWDRPNASAEEIKLRGQGSADIRAIAELINTGDFSGYVLHPGNVRKAKHLIRPDIPLIYKIDGHLTQPKAAGIPANIGSIEDALELGASAIGATFYPGGEHVKEDMERLEKIGREAHKAGLAFVVWAYARGPGLSDKMEGMEGITQADSLYWCAYAVSVAEGALGADIIKTKFPVPVKKDNREAYNTYVSKVTKKNSTAAVYKYLEPKDAETTLTEDQHIFRAMQVVQAAPSSIVIFSGGPKKKGDPTKTLLWQTGVILKAGSEGCIYGRNVWGVPPEKSLEIVAKLKDKLEEYNRELVQPRFTRDYEVQK